MARDDYVPRPSRKSEFTIKFGNLKAERGWLDLLATRRNALADAWEFLATTPHKRSPLSDRLHNELGRVTKDGYTYDRWQLKLNHRDGARIWYFVDGTTVILERVFTAHPNDTK